METVLGLSVTATNVQTVLVEGRGADGVTLQHDEFDVFTGAASAARASEQVAEAVLSIAESDGHRLHAIGVTWSRDADVEAALVMDSLADLGFDNVVPVQLPQAAEALARSIGTVIGYQRTAVCVVEPATVVLSLVDTIDGEVETLVRRTLSADDLLTWVASVFDRDDWRPEGLFLVGSVGGLGVLAADLERGLGLPVFDPPEAELAVAHGAALASALGTRAYGLPGVAPSPVRRPVSRGPAAMLVGGAVTFVVSAALAISPHLLPDRELAPAAHTQVRAELPKPLPAAPPPAPAPAVALPEVPEPEAVEPPAAVEAPAVQPATQDPPGAVEPPAAPPDPAVDGAPAYRPAPPVEAVAPPAGEPPMQFQEMNPPPPAQFQQIAPPAPVLVPQVPVQQPRLRDRILDKIPGLNRFAN